MRYRVFDALMYLAILLLGALAAFGLVAFARVAKDRR